MIRTLGQRAAERWGPGFEARPITTSGDGGRRLGHGGGRVGPLGQANGGSRYRGSATLYTCSGCSLQYLCIRNYFGVEEADTEVAFLLTTTKTKQSRTTLGDTVPSTLDSYNAQPMSRS
eukprot:scaffold12886_cov73-Phaeocystis_antarctica.AAC.4